MQRLIPAFFLIQGLATFAWWVWLKASPEAAGLFFLDGSSNPLYGLAFWADVAVYAPVSLLAGGLALRGSSWAFGAACLATGATAYAFALEVAANGGFFGCPLSDLLMALSLVGGAGCAWSLRPR